jgi:hypothetical protein
VAGDAIALRCAVVILGINKPLVVEVISKAAEASGFYVLIPTWAKVLAVNNNAAKRGKKCFIGLFFLIVVLLPSTRL